MSALGWRSSWTRLEGDVVSALFPQLPCLRGLRAIVSPEESARLSLRCPGCSPSSGASSPRGRHPTPFAAQQGGLSSLSLPGGHPGSVPQIRKGLVAVPLCLRMENLQHPAGSAFPGRPAWQHRQEGNPALLMPPAVSPRKEQA